MMNVEILHAVNLHEEENQPERISDVGNVY